MFSYEDLLTLRRQIVANPALTEQLSTLQLCMLVIGHQYGEDAFREFILEDCGHLVLCTPLGAERLMSS